METQKQPRQTDVGVRQNVAMTIEEFRRRRGTPPEDCGPGWGDGHLEAEVLPIIPHSGGMTGN